MLSACNTYLQLCPCRLQPGWRQANSIPCGLGALLNAASYLLQSMHVRIQVQRGRCLHLHIIAPTSPAMPVDHSRSLQPAHEANAFLVPNQPSCRHSHAAAILANTSSSDLPARQLLRCKQPLSSLACLHSHIILLLLRVRTGPS